MFRREANNADFNGTGEDFLYHLKIQARSWRRLMAGEVTEDLGDSTDQLIPFVGKSLVIRSLDGSTIIQKSRFKLTDPYAADLYRYDYVADNKQPWVAEAVGRLDIMPSFGEIIRLKERDHKLFGSTAYYHVQALDADFEPRISVEVIESK